MHQSGRLRTIDSSRWRACGGTKLTPLEPLERAVAQAFPARAAGAYAAGAGAARDGVARSGVRSGRAASGGALPVQPDEPLRRRAIDQRRPRSPGMRVGMRDRAARQQGPVFVERRADRFGRLEHVQPAPARHPVVCSGHRGPPSPAPRARWPCRVRNPPRHGRGPRGRSRCPGRRSRNRPPAASRRGRSRRPRSGVGGDMAPRARSPETVRSTVKCAMPVSAATLAASSSATSSRSPTRARLPSAHAVDADQHVVERLAVGDRPVARHGPGRGGPDRDRGTGGRQRARDEREAHPDRGCSCARDTRSRPRPAPSSRPGSTSPAAARDRAARSAGTARSRPRSPPRS